MVFFGMLILQLNMPSKLSILKCFAKEIQNPVEKRNKTKQKKSKETNETPPKPQNTPTNQLKNPNQKSTQNLTQQK